MTRSTSRSAKRFSERVGRRDPTAKEQSCMFCSKRLFTLFIVLDGFVKGYGKE